MIAVIQRVSRASLRIDGKEKASLKGGLLILLGISKKAKEEDIPRLAKKILNLRIFSDEGGKMNLSVTDVKGGILLVSQFTLCADASKGNRPSFGRAMDPAGSFKLYGLLRDELKRSGLDVQEGQFGAHMEVELVNDGPVTLILP